MEERKLKEIEAKLSRLIKKNKNSQQPETAATSKDFRGIAVIRRRKGHRDLPVG